MSRATPAGTATVRLLCRTFGISRQAYYGVQRRKATTGKVVVLPARPGVASAEAVLKAIRAVIAREPAWGVRKVWATLRRDGLRVSRKRVWALMNAHGLVLASEREPGGPPPRGHVVVPEPNRRWATDLTTVWTGREGWVAVALTIDCGCRTLLGLDVTKDQSAPAMLRSIEEVLRELFGDASAVPAGLELRSDHGPQYTGADCAALVERWGLTHTFAPVGRPTGNAVVERVIRTMKEEVVWLQDWDDAAQLRAALVAWQRRYNETRPHQSLGWLTPAEYRAERLGAPTQAAA
jgi:transposase InsO family protein